MKLLLSYKMICSLTLFVVSHKKPYKIVLIVEICSKKKSVH